MSNIIELKGKVVMKIFSPGSKSEHDGIYLDTGETSYILRRQDGNPFNDPVLKEWIGRNVKAKGFLHNNLFLAQELTQD